MPNVCIEVSCTRTSSYTLKFTHAHKFKLVCADYVFMLSDAANDAIREVLTKPKFQGVAKNQKRPEEIAQEEAAAAAAAEAATVVSSPKSPGSPGNRNGALQFLVSLLLLMLLYRC